MPHAIIRVAKIKTAGAARGKTAHNYRLMQTPNADQERTVNLNKEYINTGQTDYWTLAEQRIAEVITRKVRDDQVRAMEVILTASPEWFKRDKAGQAEDVRGGQWIESNLNFLKEKFGVKNLVSFTLHQDETTPHIHAVIIPITQNEKGKHCLSADRLFNPKTLRELQTDYASAMAPHGLQRGIEGSRRQHDEMKRVYGQQARTAAELAPLVQPVPARPFVLPEVPLLGRDSWRVEQQAAINGEIARQVGQANQRAQEVGIVAVANANGRERAEVLERQLNASEGQKQANYAKFQEADQTGQQLMNTYERLAIRSAQGEPTGNELAAVGREFRQIVQEELTQHIESLLKGPIRKLSELAPGLAIQGFTYERAGGLGATFTHQTTAARFTEEEIKPYGQAFSQAAGIAIERTQRAEQAAAVRYVERENSRGGGIGM